MKAALGIFLLVHGAIHLLYFAPPDSPDYPMTAAKSWLVTRLGVDFSAVRLAVAILVVITTVAFAMLALSHWGVLPQAWLTTLALIACSASLLLIFVTWNYQFVVGVAIDLGILYWAYAIA